MEERNPNANNIPHGDNAIVTPNYPDPGQLAQTPYPALQTPTAHSAPRSAPAAVYGPFPGSQTSPAYDTSYGSLLQRPGQINGNLGLEHHVTDMSAFNTGTSEPPHLAPTNPLASPSATQLTAAQRLAHLFQVRHGDPGNSTSRPRVPSLDGGNENLSHLAGVWQEDLGGRAAQAAAWHARKASGANRDQWEDAESARDPDVQALFEEEDVSYAAPRGGRGRGRGKKRGGWRQLLKGTEHANVGKAERGRGGGRGRPRGRGVRGGRRSRPVDPGPEFKRYLQLANKSFMDGQNEEAADFARQAIQANPEVWQAHSLLSQILEAEGRLDDALGAMRWGATCSREPEVWIRCAEKILQAAGDRRTKHVLRDAVDCYAEVLKLVKGHKAQADLELQVRMTMIEMYKELHDSKLCRVHCKTILRNQPENTVICREYAMLAGQWQDQNDMKVAQEAYDRAFEYYQDEDEFGAEDDETDQFSHLNIYLDLVEYRGNHAEGIFKAKQLARRFLGRKHETFWERYVDDDREFDDGNDRRMEVTEFRRGQASQDLTKYGQGLPIEIKVKFGILRMNMGQGHHQEGLKHFEPLLDYADEIEDYHDMFTTVASALRRSGYMSRAAEYYDQVRRVNKADDPDFGLGEDVWMQMATCYQALERHDDAIFCFEVITSRRGDNYGLACARLAKLHEDLGNHDQAKSLANDLILLNRRDLLYEAGVRMVPVINRPPPVRLPPELEARLAANANKSANAPPKPRVPPPAPRQLKELRPSGPIPPSALPPPSADTDTIDQQIAYHKSRKRKRGEKAKRASRADEDAVSADDQPEVKRPRLTKSTVPTKAQIIREQRAKHIQDIGERSSANFDIILRLWPAMIEGQDLSAVDEWVEAANGMLEDFLSMKIFFPDRDRHVKLRETENPGRPIVKNVFGRADEVGSNPKEFLRISFADWHHVFVDLALVYAKSGEQDRCYRVVQDVLFAANVFFQSPNLHQISFGVGIYCGLTFNDSQYLIDLSRSIITDSEYRGPMTYQLFAAVNRFSFGSNWFSAGPSQKFMLRMVKMFDYLSMEHGDLKAVREKVDWAAQKNSLEGRAARMRTSNETFPKEPDAGILLMYGHMVAVANHSHSSLPYYYRALALQPDNICVNLSIAAMWVQTSMKRQTENRQYGITQGLSFLYRYYDLRAASGKACHLQEAEYNVARMWHYLGLTHLAVPAYEKVLALSEKVQAEAVAEATEEDNLEYAVEDYATEAAFALQGIYALTGNLEAANVIGERWLVI